MSSMKQSFYLHMKKSCMNCFAGKQGKHVYGHNNSNPSKSHWLRGKNGVVETQQGWMNGTQLPDGTKVWDTGKVIGENGETGVRVHIDGKGNIHGYPVDITVYTKYLGGN